MGLPSIGPLELIIILAIALLVVGPGRLPEMGNAIGRTIREFRKASSDLSDVTSIEAPSSPPPPPSAAPEPTPDATSAPASAPLPADAGSEAGQDPSHDRADA